MTGSLLRSGKLTDYRALGDAGQKVFSAAAQIRQAVKYKVSPEAPAYLAIPQINDKGDTIDWYAPEAGEVVPWSAATPQEQADAREKLEQAQQALVETSQSIQQAEGQAAANDSEQQLFARLLDKVIQFPSPEHVYIVNGKPVLTFWGFSALNDAGGNSLDWLRPATVSTPPVPPQVAATAVVSEEPRRRFPWWWLLLALLLLLLLLWLLRGCWQSPEAVAPPAVTDPGVTEPVSEPDPATDPARIERDPEVVREVIDSTVTDVGGTRTDTLGVGDPAAEGMATDPTAVEELPGEQPLPDLPEEQTPATEDPMAQDDPAAEEDPLSEEQMPPEDPLAEQPLPEEEGEQPQIPPPELPETEPQTDPSQQQPPQQPLNIPEQAQQSGNTDFLNGGWQSNTGLQDSKTGQSMQMQYDFEDGQGKIRISGGDLTCEGPTSASMSQGSLTIPGTPVTCSDGSTLTAPQVVCNPGQDGAADCTGSYDGGYSFPVNMNKTDGGDNP